MEKLLYNRNIALDDKVGELKDICLKNNCYYRRFVRENII